jgi:1,4-dihydroxy-2-naphthoyl-CoA hydrolase
MYIDESVQQKVEKFIDTMPRNMGHALGIKFLSFKKDEVTASMPVDENTIQPFGILHGGASVALAETIASIGAWLNIEDESKTAVGVEINANHIKAMRKGTSVVGTACPIHRGRKIQVWETKIHTPEDKLVCISRCTLAIVERQS